MLMLMAKFLQAHLKIKTRTYLVPGVSNLQAKKFDLTVLHERLSLPVDLRAHIPKTRR
jgi:hypothetical protein